MKKPVDVTPPKVRAQSNKVLGTGCPRYDGINDVL